MSEDDKVLVSNYCSNCIDDFDNENDYEPPKEPPKVDINAKCKICSLKWINHDGSLDTSVQPINVEGKYIVSEANHTPVMAYHNIRSVYKSQNKYAKNAILAMLCIEGTWIKVTVLKLFEEKNSIKYFNYQNNKTKLTKLSEITDLYVNQIVSNRSIVPHSINEHDGCFQSKKNSRYCADIEWE